MTLTKEQLGELDCYSALYTYPLSKEQEDYLYRTRRSLGDVILLDQDKVQDAINRLEIDMESNPYTKGEWILVKWAYLAMVEWIDTLSFIDRDMLKERLRIESLNDIKMEDKLRECLEGELYVPTMEAF